MSLHGRTAVMPSHTACRQCPEFPIAEGEFVTKKLCIRAKKTVTRKTPACDAGRGRMLFQGEHEKGKGRR